jgi:hypothetical protein
LTIEIGKIQREILKKSKDKGLKEEWEKIEKQTKTKMIECLLPSDREDEISLSRSILTNIKTKTTDEIFAFLAQEDKEAGGDEQQKEQSRETEIYNYILQITRGMFEKKMSDKRNGETYWFS